PLHSGIAGLHPTGGTECPMILLAEFVTWLDVVVEEPAVVDHARDELYCVLRGGRQTKTTRPRLQRVQNHHRPIQQWTESLEAKNQVEGKSVGGSRSHAQSFRQSCLLHFVHRLPDRVAAVAR